MVLNTNKYEKEHKFISLPMKLDIQKKKAESQLQNNMQMAQLSRRYLPFLQKGTHRQMWPL